MNECAKAMLNHYNGSECIHLHLRSFMNTGIRLVFTLCRYIIYYSSHALVHTHSSADGTFECQLPMLRLHTHPAATKLLELFFNRVHLATMCCPQQCFSSVILCRPNLSGPCSSTSHSLRRVSSPTC